MMDFINLVVGLDTKKKGNIQEVWNFFHTVLTDFHTHRF